MKNTNVEDGAVTYDVNNKEVSCISGLWFN